MKSCGGRASFRQSPYSRYEKYHLDTPLKENAKFTEGKRGDGRIWDAYTPPGPRRHGFDFWHSYGCCDWHLKPHYWEGDAKVDERIDVNEWSVKHETDVAVRYLRNEGGNLRKDGEPFALFVAFNPPHPPFNQVPDRYRKLYEGRTPVELLNRPNVRTEGKGKQAPRVVRDYFAAVSGVDEQFGRILQALEDGGLTEDTIVVFSSDHGEMMGSHGRMGKSVYHEESFRIPMIMRYPRRLRPARDELHLNDDPAEVIAGKRSLKADSTSSKATYHEYLRLPDLIEPGKHYEVSYDYCVLATRADAQFYTVVRSRSDLNKKASRLYWDAKAGDSGRQQLTFDAGEVTDHQLIFGVKGRGAIVVDNIVIAER